MAVRIVEMKPDPSVVRRSVCRNCGVLLEYTPADIQKRVHRDYTGCAETVHFIRCPSCDNEITSRTS